MDFSAIVPVIQTSVLTVVAALTAIALVRVAVDFARWAYSKVIGWFGNDYYGGYKDGDAWVFGNVPDSDDDRTPEEIAHDEAVLRERGEW